MGMLKGNVIGPVMAIAIAEIGAQGAERTFTIVSRDANWNVSTCKGCFGYMLDDGTIFEGDVRNTDLEKAIPAIKQTGIVQPSMVRGHFRFMTTDGEWLHIDTGFGNHLLVHETIARSLSKHFAGHSIEDIYANGINYAIELLKDIATNKSERTTNVQN